MSEQWYEHLYEECVAIMTEYSFLSRFSRVEGYHALGQRIMEENGNMERSKHYGKNVIAQLSKRLGTSERTLEYAVAFAKKFPDLSLLPMGKNATWTMVCEELLPEVPREPRKAKVKTATCPHCHTSFLITPQTTATTLADTPNPNSSASLREETHTT